MSAALQVGRVEFGPNIKPRAPLPADHHEGHPQHPPTVDVLAALEPRQRPPAVLGLNGYSQVGKDTLGRILVNNHGFERVAFADKIKAVLRTNPDLGDEPSLRDLVAMMGWRKVWHCRRCAAWCSGSGRRCATWSGSRCGWMRLSGA